MIGLALGAGAAQGLAHIGVLEVIEEEAIPVDAIAGTSIGAVIGAFWASGMSASEIKDAVSIFKKRMAAWRLVDLCVPKRGLIKGREIKRFLESQLGKKTFRDTRIPLKIVTCDIEKREEVVLDKGRLADVALASIAIPGMFEPVNINGRILVDGGILNPLPTSVLSRMGISNIIAVNTLPSPSDVARSGKRSLNIFDLMVRNIQASEFRLAELDSMAADITMHPVIPHIDWYEIYEMDRFIRRGRREATLNLARMKRMSREAGR